MVEHARRAQDMAKIDAYLRSIEKYGAAGAILTSGQAVTLRFPGGDRNATQVTPHDLLVGLVREVAPPPALEALDQQRPARFELDSNGTRFAFAVTARPGAWQVAIELAAAAAPAAPAAPAPTAPARTPRIATAPVVADPGEMAIERGQYDAPAAAPTSGSAMLDQLTAAARGARATDIYLATGAPPALRIGGELQVDDRAPLDGETLSRELGIVAPAEARAAWSERGGASFTYGDGGGRVRVTLARDHRGPAAALRLLVPEPPTLDRLGISREVAAWLDARGLVLVAGLAGAGKTTTLAALVRELGERRRRVVTIEDPIEVVHPISPWISQRAVGEHVPSIAAGVAAAMREGADAIAVGVVASPEAAAAAVAAAAAGHLVLATIAAASVRSAADQLLELLPADRREPARAAVQRALLGAIAPVVKPNGRTFEVLAGRTD